MKTTTDGWWDYWNNVEFKRMLEGNFDGGHGIAKIILWLYENHLIEKGKSGYGLKCYIFGTRLKLTKEKTLLLIL